MVNIIAIGTKISREKYRLLLKRQLTKNTKNETS